MTYHVDYKRYHNRLIKLKTDFMLSVRNYNMKMAQNQVISHEVKD